MLAKTKEQSYINEVHWLKTMLFSPYSPFPVSWIGEFAFKELPR